MRLRKLEESFFKFLMIAATLIIVFSLFLILGTIIQKGLPAMSWDMVSKVPEGGFYLGGGGGILNAIIGSLYIGIGSTLLAFFISAPIVIYLNVYAKPDSRWVQLIRLCLDIMWGIPSIVFGAFGFIIMLFFGLKVSLLAGIITISLLILPVITRAMDEVIKTIPVDLLNSSYALGATKWETAIKVVLRQAYPGIITACLLGLGRAMGDAASVMFTAGYTDNIPHSLKDPTATLPLAIFYQLSSPNGDVVQRAYAAALILTIIILVISLASRFFTKKFKKNISN